MSDSKQLESVLGGTPSRRGFLKSALMLGGALVMAGSTTAAMAEDAPDGKKKKKKKGHGKGKKKHTESHSN